jgi:hypothetical protein
MSPDHHYSILRNSLSEHELRRANATTDFRESSTARLEEKMRRLKRTVVGELSSMRSEIAELHTFITSMDELYSQKFA